MFQDAPAPVEERVAHRREIEEAGVVVAGELQGLLGGAQLTALHLQLDAAGLEVEEELAPLVRLGALAERTHELLEPPLERGFAEVAQGSGILLVVVHVLGLGRLSGAVPAGGPQRAHRPDRCGRDLALPVRCLLRFARKPGARGIQHLTGHRSRRRSARRFGGGDP
jgi:hypothetical protein